MPVRDLRVWQDAVALAGDAVRALRPGHRRETAAVTESAMAAALAVTRHIAEGYARHAPDEQRAAYRAAKAALLRLETELAVARRAELLAEAAHRDLESRCGQVGRLLTGLLAYLDRQLGDPSATDAGSAATPGFARAPA